MSQEVIHSMKENGEWKGTRDERAVLKRVVREGFIAKGTLGRDL